MEPTLIVVVTACVVLGISLLATIIWLLYRFARKKSTATSTGSSDRRKKATVSLPPMFQLPPQYSTARVQAPIFEHEEGSSTSSEPEPSHRERFSLPLLSNQDQLTALKDLPLKEFEAANTKTLKQDFKSHRSFSASQATGRKSVGELSPRSPSSPFIPEEPSTSPVLLRVGGADTKRRRISVDLFQHLKAQGRKPSVGILSPSPMESIYPDSLPVAAQLHRSRSPYEKRGSAESIALTPHQSDSDSENGTTDTSEKLDVTRGPEDKRRLGMARRRGSEQVLYKKAGKLTFATEYYPSQNKLEVHILRAFDIAKRKAHDNIFPFVRLYLLPGKRGKQHTKAQKKTKEPFFNEKKYFTDLPSDDLNKYRLKMKLYNRDSVTKNELLGETSLALSTLNTDQRETFSLDLTIATTSESNGQIMVSLCHQATFSQLQVIIHKARNLRKVGIMGTPDAYVSILFCRDNGWEKKDTKTKRGTRNPVFNETFNFDVTTDSSLPLSTFSLVVTVTHRSLVGKDEIIGHVIFSLESPQNTSTEHWKSITSSPHRLEAEWHSLLDPEEL